MKYEYKIVMLPGSDVAFDTEQLIRRHTGILDECSSGGWELIAIDNGLSYWRREGTAESSPIAGQSDTFNIGDEVTVTYCGKTFNAVVVAPTIGPIGPSVILELR